MAKPIDWRGSSFDDLRAFPDDAKRNAGYQLRKVQKGEQPDAFKPMAEIGAGVYEIIVDTAAGWFRVMYVAKFEETPCMCCTHSRRRPTRPPKATKMSRSAGTAQF